MTKEELDQRTLMAQAADRIQLFETLKKVAMAKKLTDSLLADVLVSIGKSTGTNLVLSDMYEAWARENPKRAAK